MPRLDGYLDEERIRSFKENFYADYSQLHDKKIILFAPTYAGSGRRRQTTARTTSISSGSTTPAATSTCSSSSCIHLFLIVSKSLPA